MFAVAVVGNNKVSTNARLINGWGLEKEEVIELLDDLVRDFEEKFKDDVILLNGNFTILGTSEKTFQINLNKDGVKSTKVEDFVRVVIDQLKVKDS